jgi:thiol-disulfide isomerase/thioredoxin
MTLARFRPLGLAVGLSLLVAACGAAPASTEAVPAAAPEATLTPIAQPVAATPRLLAATPGGVTVTYFFADLCPNCPLMEPLLMDALGRYARADVRYVPLNLDKALHRSQPELVRASLERAAAVADVQGVRHVYDAYFQYTGLAVISAQDTGEVISCLARSLTADEMQLMIDDARRRVRAYPQLGRTPEGGPDCPPPVS